VADGHEKTVWSKSSTHYNQIAPPSGGANNTSEVIPYSDIATNAAEAPGNYQTAPKADNVTPFHQVLSTSDGYGKFISSVSNVAGGYNQWYNPNYNTSTNDSYLWGQSTQDYTADRSPAKNGNDPSPQGWKVPSSWDLFDIIGGNGTDEPIMSIYDPRSRINYPDAINNGWTWRAAGNRAIGGALVTNETGESVFLHAAGQRNSINGELINATGLQGMYWSSTRDGSGGSSLLMQISPGGVNAGNSSSGMALGASIRPIVETPVTTRGTDFWLTFGSNTYHPAENASLVLKIAASEAANVTLTFTENGSLNITRTVPANSTIDIDLTRAQREAVYTQIQYNFSSGTNSKSLHITSDEPISVYALNAEEMVTDASIILPVDVWGKEYRRLSYKSDFRNQANTPLFDVEIIIAKEDGTQTLNAGQVFYRSGARGEDHTGNTVSSTKPVAYFAHNTGAKIPAGYTVADPYERPSTANRHWQDLLFEQMMPIDRWGKEFLVPNAKQGTNTMNNLIRIMASKDGTKVNFTGATRYGGQDIASGGTLNAGQWVELLLSSNTGACHIAADKPVGVAAYLVGDGEVITNDGPLNDGVIHEWRGDPTMSWIPPLAQMTYNVLISPFMITPAEDVTFNNTQFGGTGSQHFMIVVAKSATKTQTKINGSPVNSGWQDNASGYSYYVQQFNNPGDKNASFKIENLNGVMVLGYGISDDEAYYYNAGSGGGVINP
jgi:hypothetical protein